MKDIKETLEFNKILLKLSDYAVSGDAKSKCEKLSIIKNKEDLFDAISEVDAATTLMKTKPAPNFHGLSNVDEALVRLSKEGSLNTKELLNISSILTIAENIIQYKKSFEFNTCLDKYIDALKTLPFENEDIKRIIISENEIADNASSVLLAIRRKKMLLKEKVHTTANRLLNTYHDYLQEPVLATKDGAICLPVKSEYKTKIDGTVHAISSTQYTIFIEPKEIIGLNNELAENESLEQIEITKILFELSKKLSPHIDLIKSNYQNLLSLDFIFAKAKYAKDEAHTLPLLNEEGIIDIYNGKHPLINKEKVVPLNINLGKDYTTLVITGPNTGGKTVSLKTVGLIELMGLSGMFIPAGENSKVAIFDNIYADIGDEQSIEQSLSTFSSHMNNIVDILKHVTNKSLVLFDEICTGTDPIEGANLAISILNKLLSMKIRTLATTHYPELKRYALTKPNVKNGAFEFDVATLKPTYRLLIGIPGKSNAFAISEKLGLNKDIIENAKKLLDTNDVRFEDVVSSLEESRKTIEKEKNDIELYKKEIEELKDKVKRQEKGLLNRADSIIRKAKEQAHDIIYDAKTVADETIKNMKSKDADLQSSMKERTRINKALNDITDSMIEKTKGPAQPLSAKKIKIGATVKVLSLNSEGIVETLPDKDYNLFVRIGIIRTKVNLRDLELIISDNIEIEGTKIKRTYDKSGGSKIKLEKSYTVSTEINLIGKTTDEALLELDKYIDDACIAHIPSVRIIHGRGTGALKNAVKEYCRKSEVIKDYRFGDYNEGGDGVTVVTLS